MTDSDRDSSGAGVARGGQVARTAGCCGAHLMLPLALALGPLLMSDLWMCGMTPPPAMVALMSVSSSSSPRMASCAPARVWHAQCLLWRLVSTVAVSVGTKSFSFSVVLVNELFTPYASRGYKTQNEFAQRAVDENLQVSWSDTLHAEVARGVAGELQHLCAEPTFSPTFWTTMAQL